MATGPVPPVARNRSRLGEKEQPPPPEWTIEKVLKAVDQGRYFYISFENATELRRYEQRIYQEAVSALGSPLSDQGTGAAMSRATYWPNKGGIGLTVNPPENPGTGVDVVRLQIPEHW
ncbi:MAG: hypothetical protein GTO63_16410 [Anaerolineae bacterium]|nr:hypothetical protein [Anaerolineae bacterium]NIN96400.1 hypothetical protein [Anaerolineae bacterium]NIQ79436.1 hypothetical protein [Anaerolineae bacterium]